MKGIELLKAQMAKYQEEMKSNSDMLLQLKQAHEKIESDIKLAQSKVDTFSGAVQAADLAIKALETSEPKVEEVTSS